MIVLDSTSRSLVAVLGGAVTTNQPTFVCSYLDHDASTVTEGVSHGQLNGVTEVTLVPAPASGVRRLVKTVQIHNLDTASVALTVSMADGATRRAIISSNVDVANTVWIDETISLYPPAAGGSGPTAYVASLNSSTGSITITGSGIVSVSTTGARGIVVHATQSVQTQGLMSLNGSSGAITITGSGNATVSTTGASGIVVHVTTSQSVQTQGLVQSVNGSEGTITIVGSGINTVSTTAAGAIVIHATTSQSVQTQNTLQVNGSTGSVTLVAGNLMSVSNNASTVSLINVLSSSNYTVDVTTIGSAGTLASRFALADHQHRGVRAIVGMGAGGTATFYGDLSLAAGTGATLSTGAGAISIYGGGGGAAGSNTLGMSNLGNTAGTTGVVSGSAIRYHVVGGDNVTVSQSLDGASGTASIIVAPPVAGTLGVSTMGNTAGSTGFVSGPQTRYVLVGSNNITLSQALNVASISGTLTILGPNLFTLNGTSDSATLVAGNLMSVSNNASTISVINLLSSSNTATPVSTVTSAGALGSRFALADHAHAGVGGMGISNTGSTAGNTGTQFGTWVLAGSNVTLSGSTGGGGVHTAWVSAAPGGGATFSAGMSNLGNTAGTSGTVSGQLVLVGSNNVTLSQSINGASGTVSFIAPSPGGGAGGTIHQTSVGNQGIGSFAFYTIGAGSVAVQNMPLQCELQMDRVVCPVSVSVVTATNSSGLCTVSLYAGIYTSNANTLSLEASASVTYTGSNTSNGSTASYSGIRLLSIPFSTTLSAGDYWVALMTRITTAGNSVFAVSNMVASNISTIASGPWGAASNASVQIFGLGIGHRSATSAGMPASIAFADIRVSNYYRRQMPCLILQSGTA